MSTTEWTNPVTEEKYKIGTVGWEYNNKLFKLLDIALDVMRDLGSLKQKGFASVASFLLGAIDGNGAKCPTYGFWAGEGWAGDQRLATSENPLIRWEQEPCYNLSIKGIENNPNLNPESCYSLVDAITKTHDWMYTLAEDKKAANIYNEAQYKDALLTADVKMLQNIENAVKNGFYDSPAWVQNPNDLTWSIDTANLTTYTNTLDQTEKAYK